MDFSIGNTYHGFILTEIWPMTELSSTAYLFSHKKTKARLLYLKNTDDNKVFCVSFRTLPCDDCGTAHIMEHSVLCGSDKYPLKEPFVELLKSSLNTFLNAMTYPDKTMYPVASTNENDLTNLIDVYCDAVFNPLCITDPFMFMQEGWHYHITDSESPLTINGVVYNEMKGALSDPEELIERGAQLSLYPDTSYAYESGGDPEFIPQLSYEKYVEFYKKYYHPSNSYIYFYGDTDIEKHLKNLDERYLSHYEEQQVESLPSMQTPFTTKSCLTLTYPVSADDETDGKCYFSMNYKIGDANDTALSYRFDVLNRILMGNEASPLMKALKDAELADDIDSDYTTCVREPYYSIIAKNARQEDFERFSSLVEETLKDICEKGIDKALIESALNKSEFDLREADSGAYPKGLIYLLDIMESWLYDAKPGIHLEYEQQLKMLKENINSDYYTAIIREYLLENKHSCAILLTPEAGGTEKKEEHLHAILSEKKAGLSDKELEELIDNTNSILTRQSAPDSEEAKKTVPLLALDEISPLPQRNSLDSCPYQKATIHTHEDVCRGIVYTDINFRINHLNPREVCAASLLSEILADYPTTRYNREELANVIGMNLGDIDFCITSVPNITDVTKYTALFTVTLKTLRDKTKEGFDIASLIMNETKFDDEALLMRTVGEQIAKFDSRMISSAHNIAFAKLDADFTAKGAFCDCVSGFKYYNFLLEAKEHLSNSDGVIKDLLKETLKKISVIDECDILISADKTDIEKSVTCAKEFISAQPTLTQRRNHYSFSPFGRKKEAFISRTDVAYTGMGLNITSFGKNYRPFLSVAQKYLTSDYLWNKVRVIGGAYGAMMKVDTAGTLSFVSYRDPHIKQTLDVYNGLAEHFKTLSLSREDLTKLVIGTFSDIDSPVQPYTRGRRALYSLYKNETYEMKLSNRQQILSTTNADLRSLTDIFELFQREAGICVIASQSKITKVNNIFDSISDITKQQH